MLSFSERLSTILRRVVLPSEGPLHLNLDYTWLPFFGL